MSPHHAGLPKIDNVYLEIELREAPELRNLTSTRQRDYNRQSAHEVQVDD
jgi:hypothetical protein